MKTMKKIEIIIKSEKLEELKIALNELGVTGMMLTNIMGFGNQKGYTQTYRGAKYTVNLLPKVKVETVVRDDIYHQVLTKVQETVATGNIGDGKIFVYEVAEAVRIRTGETGENAI
jgi:Nitrogen regulatory protein PII